MLKMLSRMSLVSRNSDAVPESAIGQTAEGKLFYHCYDRKSSDPRSILRHFPRVDPWGSLLHIGIGLWPSCGNFTQIRMD